MIMNVNVDMGGILMVMGHVTVIVEMGRQLLVQRSVIEEKDVITQHVNVLSFGRVLENHTVFLSVGMGGLWVQKNVR